MPATFSYLSKSEKDTFQLGSALAAALTSGMTIALDGQLGSGKTNLVRAVCGGLNIDVSQVNSPTFVLMQSYHDGRMPVVHFDTYRLADTDEFLAIGGEEYLLDPNTICFVEWSERIDDALPADHLAIRIEQMGETTRQFNVHASGPNSQSVIDRLRHQSLN